MALSALLQPFISLAGLSLTASLLAHGIHRMSYSHVELLAEFKLSPSFGRYLDGCERSYSRPYLD